MPNLQEHINSWFVHVADSTSAELSLDCRTENKHAYNSRFTFPEECPPGYTRQEWWTQLLYKEYIRSKVKPLTIVVMVHGIDIWTAFDEVMVRELFPEGVKFITVHPHVVYVDSDNYDVYTERFIKVVSTSQDEVMRYI